MAVSGQQTVKAQNEISEMGRELSWSSRGESCWGNDFSVGPLTTGCITEQNAGSILKKCTGYAKFRKSKLSIHVTPLTGR